MTPVFPLPDVLVVTLLAAAAAWEKEVGCYQVMRTTRLLVDGVLLPSVKCLSSSLVRVLIQQEEEIKPFEVKILHLSLHSQGEFSPGFCVFESWTVSNH